MRDQANKRRNLSILVGFICVLAFHCVLAEPAQDPLFLTKPVRPLMMLNMSNDHQLFFKLYDDYSDLTGDGWINTTYTHEYDYFGYFDSDKCYTYSTDDHRFEPKDFADDDRYCSGDEWSGNFLNWATMTRMDAVRKILYGGLRSTDTSDETVLERAFLPNDAHSFAKYYQGDDLPKLTPFGTNASDEDPEDRGVTICNTTDPENRAVYSQDVDDPPLMRVARGNFSLWASNERWQCRWGVQKNDNDPSLTGIQAHADSPNSSDGLGQKDYNVRVKVCDPAAMNADNNEQCQAYGASRKPIGLLQEYGEDESILFGLMTGSYGKNKSGGVLRKNIGNILDEVNSSDGTFKEPQGDDFNGIIDTLNRFRIYGYQFESGGGNQNGTYHTGSKSDQCLWARSSFSDGDCSNWGNPQSEIYLESLRYLSGDSANPAFSANDDSYIDGLNSAAWKSPVDNKNYCAPLSVIQFNASTSSYDGDNLGGASDLGIDNLDKATDEVGANENIHGGDYFVGEILNGEGENDGNQLCTEKTVQSLSDVRGTCPDAPRLEGSYHIAGLAYKARSEGIPLSSVGENQKQTVRTYGVALAPAVPSVNVPVPGDEEKTINIQPACRNHSLSPNGNCAIVDFKVVDQDFGNVNSGTLYVNWEDSEQGGDYDQDMWGIISYQVSDKEVSVTTRVVAQSTDNSMGFGYVISGTESDGFHVHSGVNDFIYGDSCEESGDCTCRRDGEYDLCNVARETTHIYDIGSSTAERLKQPLYYAAKWGGYSDDDATTDDIEEAEPETYFYATDPRKLQEDLSNAFASVAARVGSAGSVSTSSTQLNAGAYVYQARFDSEDWSGEVLAYEIDENDNIREVASATTDEAMPENETGRTIYTYDEENSPGIVQFEWEHLSESQKTALNDDDDRGQERLNWLRGDASNEMKNGGDFRSRNKLLGDIVNSSPVYLGHRDRGYSMLPADQGGNKYADFLVQKRLQPPTLFVGANDGMMHAFDAKGANMLSELFAYVPNAAYPKLATLTDPDYGHGDTSHEYLVDGPLAVGDVYMSADEQWRSVVVGTMGAGGRGVYALDVTDRDSPKVLFELSAANYPALGFVLGKPIIAQMSNGRWAAVFGNGYDSDTSQLFIVDLEAPHGDHTRVINTQSGSGLSGVALLANDYNQVQAAYAGDLDGNLWKFDLSGSPEDWAPAFDGDPLFQAKDEEGGTQSIMGTPTLGINEQKGDAVMVYFGTGKYLNKNDNSVSDGDPVDSFYAIADTGSALLSGRDALHEKSLEEAGDGRTINHGTIDWMTADGWFMDFDLAPGERVISKPLLIYDRLVFPTVIPSAVPCNYGGESWIMGVPAVGDKFVDDDVIEEAEKSEEAVFGDLDEGNVDPETGKIVNNPSGGGPPGGRPYEVPEEALGRQSWRQLR